MEHPALSVHRLIRYFVVKFFLGLVADKEGRLKKY